MPDCTLTLVDDSTASYHPAFGQPVVDVPINTDPLALMTAQLLSSWLNDKSTAPYCRKHLLEVLGRQLYRIAFGMGMPSDCSERLGKLFEDDFRHVENLKRKEAPNARLRLRLVLGTNVTKLARLPWEFLYFSRGDNSGFFVAGDRTDLILTRFVPQRNLGELSIGPGREPLKILLVVSSFRSQDPVEMDEVVGEIQKLKDDPKFELDPVVNPTWKELKNRIESFRPHLLHYAGHGFPGGLYLRKPDETLRAECLFVGGLKRENELRELANKPALHRIEEPKDFEEIDVGRIQALFDVHKPRLVFLQACEGASPHHEDEILGTFTSTARELASAGVQAVVAMQYEIKNAEVQDFAVKFYQHIRNGLDVDLAVQEARGDLGTLYAWNNPIFGSPVIYLLSNTRIIDPPPAQSDEDYKVGGAAFRCPNPYKLECGFVFQGARFCGLCGGRLVWCERCGGVVWGETNICPQCGPIDQKEQQATASQGISVGFGRDARLDHAQRAVGNAPL
jgi:hypothetical protein